MARNFTAGDHNLRKTSSDTPASVGTIAIRIKPNWSSGDSAIHPFWIYGRTGNLKLELSFQKYSDNNIYIGWNSVDEGDQRIVIADSGIFTPGTESMHILTWSDAADEEFYYVDGIQKGSRTSTLTTFTTIDQLTIGNYDSTRPQQNANSIISEWAYWNIVLDAAQRSTYNIGGSPVLIAPQALVHHYEIMGRKSPEPDFIGRQDLTVSNTVYAAHNRIIKPSAQILQFPPIAAVGGVTVDSWYTVKENPVLMKNEVISY